MLTYYVIRLISNPGEEKSVSSHVSIQIGQFESPLLSLTLAAIEPLDDCSINVEYCYFFKNVIQN